MVQLGLSRPSGPHRSARRRLIGAVTTALVATGLATGLVTVASQAPAQAALTGSVVVYQCGSSVCAIDPDVAGSERVIATNAAPAGVTRDGLTAGVVDAGTNQIRTVALAAGGVDRVMATPGSADRPEFAAISDSGNKSGWVWYYFDLGWYAQVAPAGGTWTAQASSTSQVSIGWRGDDLLTSRRGASGFDSRICIEVAGGPACDQQLVSEPDRSQQLAFPDINPAGNTLVAVRGPEGTGFGLPYYAPLALYGVGSTSGPARILTDGPDSQPEFSNEGDRVVFERQNQGIFVVNTDGSGLRRIADGSTPFWGGNRTESTPPPPTNAPPTGSFDSASGAAGTVTVSGWAFDPTVSGESIDVHLWIGGPAGTPGAESRGILTDLSREDINQLYGITGNHGFSATVETAVRGNVPVCAYAIDRPGGPNTLLGCKDVSITAPAAPNAPPVGSYDAANGGEGVLRVAGWGFDPTVPSESIDARVWIGGPSGTPGAEAVVIPADQLREDVNRANGISGNHGFDADLSTGKRGTVPVCVYLIDRPIGVNTFLGCKTVTLTGPNVPPVGSYDAANGGRGILRVAGWGFDPTVSAQSIDVRVWVGGPSGTTGAESTVIKADLRRDDVNRANGITGRHGFDVDLRTAERGRVPVCVYLIDRPIGVNTFLGCKTVSITGPRKPAGRALTVLRVLPVKRSPRSVGVLVRCPATRAGCVGRLTIRSVARIKLPGQPARRIVIAQGPYRLKAGHQRVVRIKATRPGKRALSRTRSMKAAVSVRSSRPAELTARKVVVIKRQR